MTLPAMDLGLGAQVRRRMRSSSIPAQSPQGDGGPVANGLSQIPAQGGGRGAPPGGPPQQRRWNTQRPPAPQGSGGAVSQAPTFAEMQANGQARPAPPSAQSPSFMPGASGQAAVPQAPAPQSFAPSGQNQALTGSLQQAVQEQLRNPSVYGAPQVQGVYDMLSRRLGEDYDFRRKGLNEEMAARGLSESSIAGQRYSDLATEQSRAQGDIVTQLATQAAQQYGQDRSLAAQVAAALQGQTFGQEATGYGLNQAASQQGFDNALQSAQFGQGQYQFGQQQGLAERQLSQQGSQFDRSQGLAERLGVGNLDLQGRQLTQQGQQFGQQLDLSRTLGMGNLDLSRQGQQDQRTQFGQSLALQSQGQTDQRQQFGQQLAQQLGLARMGDVTQNRQIDTQAALAQNDLYLRVAQLLSGMGWGTGGTGGTGPTGGGPPNGTTTTTTGTPGGWTPAPNDRSGGPPINPDLPNMSMAPGDTQGGQPIYYNGRYYNPSGMSVDGRSFVSPSILTAAQQNSRSYGSGTDPATFANAAQLTPNYATLSPQMQQTLAGMNADVDMSQTEGGAYRPWTQGAVATPSPSSPSSSDFDDWVRQNIGPGDYDGDEDAIERAYTKSTGRQR